MRVKNLGIFILPIILSAILTFAVGIRTPAILMAFLIVFDAVISIIASLLFIFYWRRGRAYEKFLKEYMKNLPKEELRARIAIVIPVFNEDPDTVVQTAIAADMAIENRGDVYVLDDSTDERIKKSLDEYAEIYGFRVFRRVERKGYKAGAVNLWLRKFGSKYEFMMVLDADQRPLPSMFRYIMGLFEDPKVAFVQVPQYYSKLDTSIALAAHLQLIPFLRAVMRGRDVNGSAFSLGSGTVFRVKPLLEIGGLYEKKVTEDIYTSILLHERGYKSRYLDLPLVWYGEAPLTLRAYWIQQNRWALGGFQLLKRILGSKLSTLQIFDYLNGFFYWLHVGPMSIIDIIAPIIFLLFGVYFMSIEPLYYVAIYGSIFLFSLTFYLALMNRYGYGVREYLYHQGIQFVSSLPVSIAFFQSIIGRKRAFKVTPKKKGSAHVEKYHIYFMLLIILLFISVIYSVFKLLYISGLPVYAYIVNIFWALWWLVIASSSYYVSLSLPVSDKLRDRAKQSYEGFVEPVINMLQCGAEFEKTVGEYYVHLASLYPEYSTPLHKIAKESYNHARIYSNILKRIGGQKSTGECLVMEKYIERMKELQKRCKDLSFKDCLLPEEEMFMYVYAQLILESCKFLTREEMEDVRGILEDEREHDKILRELL